MAKSVKRVKIPPFMEPIPSQTDVMRESLTRFSKQEHRDLFEWGGVWVLEEIERRKLKKIL